MTIKKTRTFHPPSHEDKPTGVKTIENTAQAMIEYGLNFSYDVMALTPKNIKDLEKGKCLASDDGENSLFIIYADSLDALHATCTELKNRPGHFEYQFSYEFAHPKRKQQN